MSIKPFTYSAAGDITQVADNVNGVTYNYGYDSLHRLISETGTGNYTVPASMAMVYGYNDASHLNAVTDIDLNGTNRTFSYDLNGNMTAGYDLTNPAAVVSRSITYTADNMPAAITRGAVSTNFTYDGDGRRAKKTTGSNTTVYVNDLCEIINAAAVKYIFAGNLRIAKITGTDIKYFHKDHLGSSTVMTNASGNSVETSEYLPYGGTRDQSGTSVSDYKFTDQELDTSTGLYNYDARLYDPVIGRFITPDTIVPDWYDPQLLNRYSYTRNNPLKYTDPSGHILVSGSIAVGYGSYALSTALAVGIAHYAAPIAACLGAWIGEKLSEKKNSYQDLTPKQLSDAKKSYEDLIREHEEKLGDYINDPDSHDNKGVLQGVSPERRQKIINGRIRTLEKQLKKQKKELEKIKTAQQKTKNETEKDTGEGTDEGTDEDSDKGAKKESEG